MTTAERGGRRSDGAQFVFDFVEVDADESGAFDAVSGDAAVVDHAADGAFGDTQVGGSVFDADVIGVPGHRVIIGMVQVNRLGKKVS